MTGQCYVHSVRRLRDFQRRSAGPYFDGPKPRVLAHRGLAIDEDENTLPAFAAAFRSGAQIIETDVRATRDGVAVLLHDEILASGVRVKDLSLDDLRAKLLPRGGTVATLAEALTAFPDARFNIDIKSSRAISGTVSDVLKSQAIDRVLVTSFAGTRRRSAVRALSGVATSASATMVVTAVLAGAIGWNAALRFILRNVDAVQIPERVLRIRTATAPMVRRFHAAGVEIHVWTINDESTMQRLIGAGVDGIVTDHCDVAVRVLAL